MAAKFSFNSLLNSVSKLISEEEVTEKKQTPQQKSHQKEIENSIIVLAAAVVRCDKNFTSDTENFFLDYFAKHFGAQSKQARLKTIGSHLETGTEPYTKIACKELKMLTTHDSRLNIIHFLFGVAASDDFVNAKEARCIQRIGGYLGISEKDIKEIKQSFLSKNNPYHVLGIEEDVPFEQVKIAYRKMVLKFHPDKRKDKATDEEANLKFREIKRAYEVIRQQQEKKA